MLTTSQEWKEALGCYNIPYRDYLVPVNDIKIEYEQIDTTAQITASVSSNGAESFSDTSEVKNLSIDYVNELTVATLEINEWVLDNSTVNVGADTHCGWVSSNVSGADGTFATHPRLTLSWSTTQATRIGGITIQFSSLLGEWATEFKITAKRNGSAVFDATFNNSAIYDYFEGEIVNYDTLDIEIIKWCLPYRRARIESVTMGLTVYIGKSDVLSAEQSMTSDTLSFTLPDDSFKFDIDNVDERWNPDNPSGVYSYLTERQRVNVKYAFKIGDSYEWHLVGTYFMSEWTTPQNGISASFTARCLIDFMGNKFNPSAISGYTYGDTISLYDLAYEAFEQAGLPIDADSSVKWNIADELDDIDIVIPYTTREEGEQTINEYAFDYTCAEVVQYCANAGCAVIRPNVEGDVCIVMPDTAVSDYYIDQFVAYNNGEYETMKALADININNGEYRYPQSGVINAGGEEQGISNPLIQSSQYATVCAWMADMLGKRKNISGEFRADPRLQPLDTITNLNKYAMNQVYITDVKWTYNGAFRGTYSGKVLKSIPLIDREGEYYSGHYYSNEYGGA